jgi:hypothetical protein
MEQARGLRPLFERAMWLDGVRSLLAFLVPGAGGAVSAILAYIAQMPLYLSIFVGAGIFCFGSVAITTLYDFYYRNSPRFKLRVSEIKPFQIQREDDGDGYSFHISCTIKNFALRPVYMDVVDVRLSIESRVKEERDDPRISMFVPPKGDEQITFATIEHVPLKPIVEGKLKISFRYGNSPKRLPYRFDYSSDLFISTRQRGDLIDWHCAGRNIVSKDEF